MRDFAFGIFCEMNQKGLLIVSFTMAQMTRNPLRLLDDDGATSRDHMPLRPLVALALHEPSDEKQRDCAGVTFSQHHVPKRTGVT